MHTDQTLPKPFASASDGRALNRAAESPAAAAAETVVNAHELLRRGIAAVKGGDKQGGRRMLLEAIRREPRNELAWLWRAFVAETPQECVSCLQRVLELSPGHEQALEWMTRAKRNLAQSLLVQGVAAAKEGDKVTARNLLTRSVAHDPTKEVAWLWLASVTHGAEERLPLLERALELNSANEQTKLLLRQTHVSVARALVQQAAEVAERGERDLARQLVERARIHNATLEEAWLLSASLTDDLEERAKCLRRAVQIDPASTRAAAMLEAARRELTTRERGAKLGSTQQEIIEHEATNHRAPETITPSVVAEARQQQHQAARRTVMVVDDSPTVRKLVTIKLEKEGHRVITAIDGKDALAKLNDEVPDLILTDITMPRMDGYQLCKLVRSDETTKHVPVIMLSGKDGFFDKVRGRMAGSTAYLTKPFEPETLLKVVTEHCGSNAQPTSSRN